MAVFSAIGVPSIRQHFSDTSRSSRYGNGGEGQSVDLWFAVQLLLDNGAEVSPASVFGETPLHLATSRGYLKIVEVNVLDPVNVARALVIYWQILLDHEADVNASVGQDGMAPLHCAASIENAEIAQVISHPFLQGHSVYVPRVLSIMGQQLMLLQIII